MLKIISEDVPDELAFLNRFDDLIKQKAAYRNNEAALIFRTQIMIQMPVRTGAAQNVWGQKPAPTVSHNQHWVDGIWEITDNGLTIEVGAEHEDFAYIIRLNEGSSRQAPAGFIDTEWEKDMDEYEKKLQSDIEETWQRGY